MTTLATLVATGPLCRGQKSDAVRVLQLTLDAAGQGDFLAQGDFGPKTEAAVKSFQFSQGLRATGIVDMATARALDAAAAHALLTKKANLPPWLEKAISLIGVEEYAGGDDNPLILAWAKQCGGSIAANYKHDATAWCKLFTEYCLVSTGYRGIDSLWALDNRKVGTPLTGPAVGAIASKERTGGGHTFFVIGRTAAGQIVGVGGNQDDRVCRATYPPAILKYNWPDGAMIPGKIGLTSLPLTDSAPLSKTEA